MKLQTSLKLKQQLQQQIDYDSKLLLLGSCFSDNIGSKFNYFKFDTLINPFGVLFHPKAIENLISKALTNKGNNEHVIFYHNEQWHSFETHSKLSHPNKNELLKAINSGLENTRQQINTATHVIITLGTAWVYRLITSGKVVANCHKVAQKQFNKEILSIKDIVESLESCLKLIHAINPKTEIIFTVSPVRHIKDGFVENMQSKAHLISAIHHFINQQSKISNPKSHYFPAYEIMMDELRDYRFYNEDMIHPNATAITYIWERFQTVYIDNKALQVMKKVDDIQKGLLHKPFNVASKEYLNFLEKIETKKVDLQQLYPKIKF